MLAHWQGGCGALEHLPGGCCAPTLSGAGLTRPAPAAQPDPLFEVLLPAPQGRCSALPSRKRRLHEVKRPSPAGRLGTKLRSGPGPFFGPPPFL